MDPDDHIAIRTVQRRLRAWGKRNFGAYPWRETSNPYEGLVAEVLLQRTRAANVVPIFRSFISRFPTPFTLCEASEGEILDVIRPLGLSWRAPLLKALGRRLSELGYVPDSIDQLLKLPAVGPYAAAAYMSMHRGRRSVIIDSNVVRLLARLTGQSYDPETRRKTWLRALADRITPDRDVRSFNYAMLDFTMQICKPGRPRCEICPLNTGICTYGAERDQDPAEGSGPA